MADEFENDGQKTPPTKTTPKTTARSFVKRVATLHQQGTELSYALWRGFLRVPSESEFRQAAREKNLRRKTWVVVRETRFIWTSEEVETKAASLTYFFILALVPLMAIGFTFFQVFGGLRSFLETTLKPILLRHFGQETGAQIFGFMDGMVVSLSPGNLGAISFLTLLVTVVFLLLNLERYFNAIFQVKKSRSMFQSFLNYWVLLTLSPLLIAVSIVQSTTILQLFAPARELLDEYGALGYLRTFLSIGISTLVFSFLYYVIPTEKPAKRAVLIGGLFAALGFEALQYINRFLTTRAFTDSTTERLYGTAPLIAVVFIYWLRLLGFITLTGACVARSVSKLAHYAPNLSQDSSKTSSPVHSLMECTVIFGSIVSHFSHSDSGMTPEVLHKKTSIDEDSLNKWLGYLEEQKLIFATRDVRERVRYFPTHQGIEYGKQPEKFLMEVLMADFCIAASEEGYGADALLPTKDSKTDFMLEVVRHLRDKTKFS